MSANTNCELEALIILVEKIITVNQGIIVALNVVSGRLIAIFIDIGLKISSTQSCLCVGSIQEEMHENNLRKIKNNAFTDQRPGMRSIL